MTHVQHFLATFFYSVPLPQPSLHRKSLITHVQLTFLGIVFILSILYNLPSIESHSWPMNNIPSVHSLYSAHPLQQYPSVESLSQALYNVPRPFVLPCPYRHTLQTIFLSSIESQLMMTSEPPSLAQQIPSHASFHHCTFSVDFSV